jgi:hypothetical protein
MGMRGHHFPQQAGTPARIHPSSAGQQPAPNIIVVATGICYFLKMTLPFSKFTNPHFIV